MKKYNVELLAPAGNVEAFMGAIHAGADAVYLGGTRFGARAYADNFTTDELISCIRYAHLFGRKVYLTVNTLMKDTELNELYDYLLPFYEVGLDAVIVQDIGVFQYIRKHFPKLQLHVSTQMTITGEYGAQMLKNMGASRIVPARELSLKEIVNMKENTGLEIETFIHGAMCYSYSGQCLFSSILGGRSGNRGRCAQPCRLPYTVDTPEKHLSECYPISLKDMCTIEHIGDFMDAGIDSFKIEGRMKKPEYAAGVTAIYRKYIDKKIKHPDKEILIDKKDLENLAGLYIRSKRQDGYYYKQNGADMITLDSPAYMGSDDSLLLQLRQKYIEKSLKKYISIYASFYCGSEVSLTLICGNLSVTITGDVMESAKNQPLTEESIKKQLSKLGDTCFEAEYIEISTDGQGFYSLKAINELRRRAVHSLEDKIIESYGLEAYRNINSLDKSDSIHINSNRPVQKEKILHQKAVDLENNGWSVLVNTLDQLKEVILFAKHFSITRIYIESELLLENPAIKLPLNNAEIFIALPYIMRKKDIPVIDQIMDAISLHSEIKGVLFRNLDEYQYLKSIGYTGKIASDAGVYIWNRESLKFWKDKVNSLTCPLELNSHEWQDVFKEKSIEKIVYGRLPMMITANCISKTSGKCFHRNKSTVAYLTDRYKKQFPVILQCMFCLNILLNSVPLSLHSKENQKWYDSTLKRISLTIENAAETINVLEFFKTVANHEEVKIPYAEYTTGHEKRGVE